MRQKHIHIALALVAVLFVPLLTGAQDVTESALKAAFIYNVAKFTNWPEETPSSKVFTMCVLGDAAVGEALERTVKGRLLLGKEIRVTRLNSKGSVRECRLLYLSGVTKEQIAQVVASVRGTPVLTIGDLAGFKELGGIVGFFFEDGQLRFTIGLESARKCGLLISAKLMTLAREK